MQLSDDVAVLPGVGPARKQALAELGIDTISDLLHYFPFRYEDMTVKDLATVSDGQKVLVNGMIASAPVLARFGRRSRLYFRLRQGDQVILVTFWNQAYLKHQLHEGATVNVYGKYDQARQELTAMKLYHPQANEGVAGVYRGSKRIKAPTIRKLVQAAFSGLAGQIPEIIPQAVRAQFHLLPRAQWLWQMHFPKSADEKKAALVSAKFSEFFVYEAVLAWFKLNQMQQPGVQLAYDNDRLRAFIRTLPFELTAAQKRVTNEICADLRRPIAMNRLLQGDVGSGKTIVAALALYAATTAGFQAALMAPTEILATQHATKLARLFAPLGLTVALLTSGTLTKKSARQTTLAAVASGAVDIVIGTHALIQADVTFHKLGLVITDEQHRFGVNQRRELAQKAAASTPEHQQPNVLALTATPIPRTLALTAYGEMEVSLLNELPANRKPIKTKWFKPNETAQALNLMTEQLSAGRQAYVVSPLVEESEQMTVQNATATCERLQKYYHGRFTVGLLHGKMKPAEKDEIMQAFSRHEIDVLVATTVIEVGVDVANASVMIILDAQQFGLAQLHQLRGRVGRSSYQGYCMLIANPKTDYGVARMQTMEATTDGFVIAEQDLKLRGQGDVLGKRQAGVPTFAVGDPVADINLLQQANQAAHATVAAPDFATNEAYAALRHHIAAQQATIE